MKKIILLLVVIVSLNNKSYAQTDITRKFVTVSLSLGFVSGNDYGSALKNYLTGYKVSGYPGWISFGLGADFRLFKHFLLGPDIKFLNGPVNISTPDFAGAPSEYDNSVFLPGITCKYYFLDGKSNSLFISANISRDFPSSDFSDFDYKSNGIEKELFLGYEFTSGFKHRGNKKIRRGGTGVKIGYLSVPVTVLDNNTDIFQQKDFGGYALSIYVSF